MGVAGERGGNKEEGGSAGGAQRMCGRCGSGAAIVTSNGRQRTSETRKFFEGERLLDRVFSRRHRGGENRNQGDGYEEEPLHVWRREMKKGRK